MSVGFIIFWIIGSVVSFGCYRANYANIFGVSKSIWCASFLTFLILFILPMSWIAVLSYAIKEAILREPKDYKFLLKL